jgi:hypothetical protein
VIFAPPPFLTRGRIWLAFGVAVAADLVQLLLGGAGWLLPDEAIDVATMVLMSRIVGFHPLLLPTFVLEFLPVADMLPTWTACVAIVVVQRRRSQAMTAPAPSSGPIIDV